MVDRPRDTYIPYRQRHTQTHTYIQQYRNIQTYIQTETGERIKHIQGERQSQPDIYRGTHTEPHINTIRPDIYTHIQNHTYTET